MFRRFFSEHVYIVAIFLFVASIALAVVNSQTVLEEILMFSSKQNAASLNTALRVFREVYTSEVVRKVSGSQFRVTHQFENESFAIPLPASMTIELGKKIGLAESGSLASLYSPYPFPWRISRGGGLTDSFKKEAWEYLKQNPEGEFYRIEKIDNEEYIRYAKADIMAASCVSCHNAHPDTPRTGWKQGDVRGILEIAQPVRPIIEKGKSALSYGNTILFVSGAFGLVSIFLVIALFQSRLRKQKELQRSLAIRNNELEQFSYRTSHDLKAPLVTVRGLSLAICEDVEDSRYDDVKRYAKKIGEHVEKLENLVTDILNLARADLEATGAEKVDIESIVKSIKDKFEKLCVDNGVEIKEEIDPSLEIYSSKVRLTQVLENLVSNGIKYCDFEKSNRYIQISLCESGSNFELSIEDNGLGIPQKFHERVFSMFQRFHPKVSYGSGLGMYIVKKHVDYMNADIRFQSSPKGTTFIIQLPRNT